MDRLRVKQLSEKRPERKHQTIRPIPIECLSIAEWADKRGDGKMSSDSVVVRRRRTRNPRAHDSSLGILCILDRHGSEIIFDYEIVH